MSAFFMILSTVAFVLFIVGLFNPKAALFWMSDKEKRKRGNSAGIYLATWFILGVIGGALADDSPKTAKTTDAAASESVNPSVATETKPDNWQYYEKKDEMSEKTLYLASCISTNTHDFDFPYKGGSYLSLNVRNMDGKNDVFLQISKGQVMSSYSSNEYVRFKFDGGEPVTYYFNSSSDGDHTYAFLVQANSLIKKIKGAKEIKIDIPIYKEGRPVFNFDVTGLQWNH